MRLRRTFLDPETRVRRQKYSSLARRDVMGRALWRSRCFVWVWGKARSRRRRSEERAAHCFGCSQVRDDLSGSRTPENQGTIGPSLALECKCAFGAKIVFWIFILFLVFSWRKVRLRRTFLESKTRVRRQK